jgi:hypothetical protein
MAKRRRSSASRGKGKKKDSPLWQWVLVALAAFLLYKGLDYFLAPGMMSSDKRRVIVKAGKKTPEPSPTAKPQPETGLIKKWSFEAAAPHLPEGAYPDNYQATPIGKKDGALLAYAKLIPGKKPGPQGMTHTQPGLRVLMWNGKNYQPGEFSFAALDPALARISSKSFVGPPQISAKPLLEGDVAIYSAKIFLSNDPREVQAFIQVSEQGADWVQLHHASGKKIPAAFLLGTTQENTRSLKQQSYGGKSYLILENGTLDPYKTYEGFQWNLQAYYWDGKAFVYDQEYSDKLTKEKKLSEH